VLSGSYAPGDLLLFAGREGGAFAAPAVLRDRAGQALRVGRASLPFAADWDGDGDLDLLIGNMFGRLFLARNESGGRALEWAAAVPLEVAGQELDIASTNAQPCLADWDGDGRPDLLIGSGDGRVLLLRDTAPEGEPRLDAPRVLVPAAPPPAGQPAPGLRSKIAVADWNGDGRPDLVLGDYQPEEGEPRPLAREEERRLRQAMDRTLRLSEERGRLERSELARWLEAHGIAPTESARHYEDFLVEWSRTDEARRLSELIEEQLAIQRRLNPAQHEHGRLWVFLRRAPPEAAPGR